MIKNIIYLDAEKMYSLSSQLFEGVTEYIINERHSQKENSESQKGPIASGRVLADAIMSGEKFLEKRFLHDHSLKLFEDKIVEKELLLDASTQPLEQLGEKISQYSFIRIASPASFVDAAQITRLMSMFNELPPRQNSCRLHRT